MRRIVKRLIVARQPEPHRGVPRLAAASKSRNAALGFAGRIFGYVPALANVARRYTTSGMGIWGTPLGLVVLAKDRINGAAARAEEEEAREGVRSTQKSTSRAQASWRVGSCEGSGSFLPTPLLLRAGLSLEVSSRSWVQEARYPSLELELAGANQDANDEDAPA
jgi:hypothetical protein